MTQEHCIVNNKIYPSLWKSWKKSTASILTEIPKLIHWYTIWLDKMTHLKIWIYIYIYFRQKQHMLQKWFQWHNCIHCINVSNFRSRSLNVYKHNNAIIYWTVLCRIEIFETTFSTEIFWQILCAQHFD